MSWDERFKKSREGEVTQRELDSAVDTIEQARIENELAVQLPFVIRPINYDIPEVEHKRYSRRELRVIGGVEYYCYFMDPAPMADDEKYTDYMKALSSLESCSAGRFTLNVGRRISTAILKDSEFFKCKCRVCTSPEQFETFYYSRDYKVVEGIRKVPCLGIIGNAHFESEWLSKKLAEHPVPKDDYLGTWTAADPEQVAARAARVMLGNMVPLHKRGISIPIEDLITPGDYTNPEVSKRLDAALEQVRHKGGETPSPQLTHVYTVNPDE